MRKKPLLIIVSICIVILIGVGAVWFATQQQPAKVEGFTFTGTIGERLQIHMDLIMAGKEVTGSYYYDKYRQPISLQGTLEGSYCVMPCNTV